MKIVTTSIAPTAVLSVGAPPGNFTVVDVSVPNVAVYEPEPPCVIIRVTVPPVGRLEITKPVLTARVTVWIDAVAQFTVMVELDVRALIFSV